MSERLHLNRQTSFGALFAPLGVGVIALLWLAKATQNSASDYPHSQSAQSLPSKALLQFSVSRERLQELLAVLTNAEGVEIRTITVSRHALIDNGIGIFQVDVEGTATYPGAKAWISEKLTRSTRIAVRSFSMGDSTNQGSHSIRVQFVLMANV